MTVTDHSFWSGKRVLVTGHTGFKGGWLSLWLQKLGAKLQGYALSPPTKPNFFLSARVGEGMASTLADIRDAESLARCIRSFDPDIVFHLAAQPLVRASYLDPVGTYATNVMGTVHLLESLRATTRVRAVVNVTTDKCYENFGHKIGYREDEPLGGHDPYSSSKACSELVTAAYRRSYFNSGSLALASARAGNVIGGGDWAQDRLVPDILGAFERGETVRIRHPAAVRPWQHVLEPISGYLQLAQRLYTDGSAWAQAWNFGPKEDDARPVQTVVQHLAHLWGSTARWQLDTTSHPHEAGYLYLNIDKARDQLGWRPRWSLEQALASTVDWRRAWNDGSDMRHYSLVEIERYQDALKNI